MQRMIAMGSGGGEDIYNPQFVKVCHLTSNNTDTYTIDPTKRYLVYWVNLTSDTYYRVVMVKIDKGVMDTAIAPSSNSGNAYGVVDLTGTTLTMKGTSSGTNYTSFQVVQLD